MDYTVSWTVIVEAENEREAAFKARALQLEEDFTDTLFDVEGEEIDIAALIDTGLDYEPDYENQ